MNDIKTKILVVEDEESIRGFITLNLRAVGYEVGEVDTGEKALAISESFRPDVIVLDLMLPGISGLEVCQRVREMRPEIFIIMLTAKSQDTDKILGLELGADDYLIKPFNPLELIARIKAMLRRRTIWELQVISGLNQGTPGLWAHNVAIKDDLDDSDSSITTSLSNQSIAVDYISNDYVTVTTNNGGTDILQVLPVDQLSSPLGIKVADLLGDTGSKAYHSARQQVLQTLQSQGIMIDEDGSEDNFGLTRRMGHWHLQGRINYHRNGNPETMEFEINCMPPANIVFYDTLYLSWQSIRDRVPNAVDAFTSPNKDIAVIKTPSKLYFFGISGEQLDSIPLGEISLKEGTSVIMAEWATGFYVDNWEKAFITNGANLVKVSAF